MRNDSVGFFWNDTPPPKPPKAEKVKRVPPNPVWLDPNYLPGLDEALRFPVQIMNNEDLSKARINREELILDIETYPNYFLMVFTNIVTGKILYFERYHGAEFDKRMVEWVMQTFTIVTFNGINYDVPMVEMACHGLSNTQLKRANDMIIMEEQRGKDIRRKFKAPALKVDHIDLIEVAPLFASLKTYAGRMHCPKMQDLPVHPDHVLTDNQIAIVRWYCVNDTANTAYLRETLKDQIELRYTLSNEYKVDLRSKSDAQIAEAVIGAELQRRTGKRPERPSIPVGTTYRYKVPGFIRFQSQLMQDALRIVVNARFVVGESGSIEMPEEIKNLQLDIYGSVYRMGIGGLHSTESTVAHYTDAGHILIDKDVTSFYPFIIMNQGLYPEHLGPAFLDVYRSIVKRRLEAKAAGNDAVAHSLKIVINGSFGKFGNKYSILYAPNFLIQTTITGQLSILMLIERLAFAGIPVVSANTDGIVIKCPRHMHSLMDQIVEQWESDTNFQTEETRYCALYSRDVNNYIAIKQKYDKKLNRWLEEADGTKCKGAYANPWKSAKDQSEKLHKNPTTTVCVEAVENFLLRGIDIQKTLWEERDIRKFVTVRSVRGGAVKVWDRIIPDHSSPEELICRAGFKLFAEGSWIEENDEFGRYAFTTDRAYKVAQDRLSIPGETEYVGKTVRWYYAKDVQGELVYASSGNKVPKSDGARPCMVFPDQFPNDIDYDWYLNECIRILQDIGAVPKEGA